MTHKCMIRHATPATQCMHFYYIVSVMGWQGMFIFPDEAEMQLDWACALHGRSIHAECCLPSGHA